MAVFANRTKVQLIGGLPHSITIAMNDQYDIITNISVEDGIINGRACCVKLIQFSRNNNKIFEFGRFSLEQN